MYGRFITDRGQVRSINEDAGGIFANANGQLLAIVADGMGGHQAGEVASDLMVNSIKTFWEESAEIQTPEESENWLKKTIEKINTIIYQKSFAEEKYQGMGTTAVVTICTDDYVTIAHIGDSRCYLLNESGFVQITDDHSYVNELVRTGQISLDDAEQHPKKNLLLRAIGTEETVKSDVRSISWDEENKLLLCSDGLTNKISDDEIEALFQATPSISALSKKLIDMANERGGEDNITLAIINNLQKEAGEF